MSGEKGGWIVAILVIAAAAGIIIWSLADDPRGSGALDGDEGGGSEGTGGATGDDATSDMGGDDEAGSDGAGDGGSQTQQPSPSPSPSETTSPSPTTTSSPSDPPPADDRRDQLIWPFATADAQPGQPYRLVGLWPHDDQDPPTEGLTQQTHRIHFWDFVMTPAEKALGTMTVSPEPGEGLVFGPGNYGARIQLYLFDKDAVLVGVIPAPTGYGHLPWVDIDLEAAYKTYYFGEASQAPPGTEPLPWYMAPFKGQLRDLMAGRYAGEGASLFVPAGSYSDLFGWGDLTITGRLDTVVAAA